MKKGVVGKATSQSTFQPLPNWKLLPNAVATRLCTHRGGKVHSHYTHYQGVKSEDDLTLDANYFTVEWPVKPKNGQYLTKTPTA